LNDCNLDVLAIELYYGSKEESLIGMVLWHTIESWRCSIPQVSYWWCGGGWLKAWYVQSLETWWQKERHIHN